MVVIAPSANASHKIGGTHGHSFSVLELMVSRRLFKLSEYFLLISGGDHKIKIAALVLVAVRLLVAPHNG